MILQTTSPSIKYKDHFYGSLDFYMPSPEKIFKEVEIKITLWSMQQNKKFLLSEKTSSKIKNFMLNPYPQFSIVLRNYFEDQPGSVSLLNSNYSERDFFINLLDLKRV